MLAGKKLKQDRRVKQAKKLLREALEEHQKELTEVRPSREKPLLYDEVERVRGSKLAYPYLSSGIGRGCLVELIDGSVKYDFTCGIGQIPAHSDLDLMEAGVDAALDDVVIQGNLQQSVEPIELMGRLGELAGLDHCFLTSSGVMAVENGMKICFQKNFPRTRVLTFTHDFAGRTLTASRVTDRPGYREGLPDNIPVDYVPFYNPKDPEATFEVLEEHLKRYPDEHALMIMELVQGEGGLYAGEAKFFQKLCDVLHEHGVLVLIDEVQTFGRTEELFAFHHFGLQEKVDVVTIGKVSQVCATLYRNELQPRPGLVSQTFTSSSSAIRACQVVLDKLLAGDRFGKKGLHRKLHDHFVKKCKLMRHVKGPYGMGLMMAFTPFDGSKEKVTEILYNLFEKGVVAWRCGGDPERIRFLPPPLAVTKEDLDAVLKIVKETLKECG
jgi:4-aminobutyrate aminotransferase-like enzyme